MVLVLKEVITLYGLFYVYELLVTIRYYHVVDPLERIPGNLRFLGDYIDVILKATLPVVLLVFVDVLVFLNKGIDIKTTHIPSPL